MKLLQFFQFAYLVFAILFIYDGIVNLGEGSRSIISFLLAGLAIFMFYFRRRFRKRFEERRREREDSNK